MRAYLAVRDWVDRKWRAPGLQFKILLLPAIIPFLAIMPVGKGPVLGAVGWVWFGIWNSFVLWRYWIYMKKVSREADESYDRIGKFRLAQEYHDTESATAAAKRKRNA